MLKGIIVVAIVVIAALSPADAQKRPKRVEVTNLPATQNVEVKNFPTSPEAPLAPTRPSQLVTISSSGNTCGTSPWRMLDRQVNGDGTVSAFTIPAGKVLVVTSIDWRQGATGAAYQQEEFFLFPSAENIDVNSNIVNSLVPGSADGRAGASLVVTGVAIKPGNPCWGVNSLALGSASALVHGFLTDDR